MSGLGLGFSLSLTCTVFFQLGVDNLKFQIGDNAIDQTFWGKGVNAIAMGKDQWFYYSCLSLSGWIFCSASPAKSAHRAKGCANNDSEKRNAQGNAEAEREAEREPNRWWHNAWRFELSCMFWRAFCSFEFGRKFIFEFHRFETTESCQTATRIELFRRCTWHHVQWRHWYTQLIFNSASKVKPLKSIKSPF